MSLPTQTVIFSRSYLPCQVLGLHFPILGVLVLKGLPSSCPSLQPAFGSGGFRSWPPPLPQVSSQEGAAKPGPLPARARTPPRHRRALPGPTQWAKLAGLGLREKQGLAPSKERAITKETLTAVLERPKEGGKGRNKAFFSEHSSLGDFHADFCGSRTKGLTQRNLLGQGHLSPPPVLCAHLLCTPVL